MSVTRGQHPGLRRIRDARGLRQPPARQAWAEDRVLEPGERSDRRLRLIIRLGLFADGQFAHLRGPWAVKGKSAIHMARVYGERKRNFVGQHFWARGFFVNTVGRDEEAIRAYIRNQEKEDQRLEQLNLWRWPSPPSGGSKLWGRV